jgi:murein DD-endopeptidase MepM/ murein hydrolase activator NlpD
MPGAPVTSCYGWRWGAMHKGVDLALASGTPIHAAGAGTVVAAGWAFSGYGISVLISHGNGLYTHYAHQSRTIVSVGQHVAAGQTIGYEGATGDATGPHLHFEVHLGLWNQVEPTAWMRAHGVIITGC